MCGAALKSHVGFDPCRKRLWRSKRKCGRGDERNAKKRKGSDSGRWSGSGNAKGSENGRENETERGSVGGKDARIHGCKDEFDTDADRVLPLGPDQEAEIATGVSETAFSCCVHSGCSQSKTCTYTYGGVACLAKPALLCFFRDGRSSSSHRSRRHHSSHSREDGGERDRERERKHRHKERHRSHSHSHRHKRKRFRVDSDIM